LRFDAEQLGGSLDFGLAPRCQRTARLAPVSDIAVGDRDKLDLVPARRPERGDTAGLKLAIVRVGAKTDDAQRAVIRRGRLGRVDRLDCGGEKEGGGRDRRERGLMTDHVAKLARMALARQSKRGL